MTGSVSSPASPAARQRRSPAMSSYLPLTKRTMSGWMMPRSEERRVGKSVDLGVTGVQTCALPIWQRFQSRLARCTPAALARDEFIFATHQADDERLDDAEIGRASCREKCRSRCDWSSDVCSSDLAAFPVPPRPLHASGARPR